MIKSVLLRFDKHLHSTDRAHLIRVGITEYWIPKKLCHRFITNKKLGGNVVIPTFLYERMFGQQPAEADAETIIENHVPVKIEPITTTPHAELTRQPAQCD